MAKISDDKSNDKPLNHTLVNEWMIENNWRWNDVLNKWFREKDMVSVSQQLAAVFYLMHEEDMRTTNGSNI